MAMLRQGAGGLHGPGTVAGWEAWTGLPMPATDASQASGGRVTVPGSLRVDPAFDDLLDESGPIAERLLEATHEMALACVGLYDLRAPEAAALHDLLETAQDGALASWTAAFAVALERFETQHSGAHVREPVPLRRW